MALLEMQTHLVSQYDLTYTLMGYYLIGISFLPNICTRWVG